MEFIPIILLRQKIEIVYLISHVSLIVYWLQQETEKGKKGLNKINQHQGKGTLCSVTSQD